jgi:DinB family protein
MESSILINKLKNNLEVYKSLIVSIDDEQSRWKPQPEKWSILEVIHHLYDEEREDFRLRLDYTLADSSKEWNPINPPQWVIDRKYNNQNFIDITNMFFAERNDSIKWLNNFKFPQWDNTYIHPIIGKITAGDLLSSWVAHDFLHLRQIITLNREYYKNQSLPFNTKYALP